MSHPSWRAKRGQSILRAKRGQSLIEYMLAVSVLVIGLAACWSIFADGVKGGFDTVRRTVQMPYP